LVEGSLGYIWRLSQKKKKKKKDKKKKKKTKSGAGDSPVILATWESEIRRISV
jgi:hypothetical protein